jgi:hypothetical protein
MKWGDGKILGCKIYIVHVLSQLLCFLILLLNYWNIDFNLSFQEVYPVRKRQEFVF